MTDMNRRDFVSILAASLARRTLAAGGQEIPIILSADATPLEKFAATELAKYLHNLFPACGFSATEIFVYPQSGAHIRLGTLRNYPQLSKYVSESVLARPDSFVVTTAQDGQSPVGIIAGSEPRGTLFAVYALLEQLGYGFYLSYDAAPRPRPGRFNFDGWNLADAPLVEDRIIFNWHNFLSGCSGWDLADWKKWIGQAAKMRFGSIMVHAYGNNPMFSFTHNGQTKPTGFITTSVRGRDWGAEHTNDVRRVWGGSGIFEGPVLGSPAARVPADQTVAAATSLMRQVFAYAESRGLGVNFALDVDTQAANPQNIIATLPEATRISTGNYLLANPETPEGLAYYESQVRQLMDAYPDIDRIVIWFRRPGTPWSPWLDLLPANFPASWKAEFREALEKTPTLKGDRFAPGMFAINKIARAFRQSLDKIGKRQVQLALGSWGFKCLPAADVFMSPEIAVIGILQYPTLGKEDVQSGLRAVARHRKVIALPYAQDDDGAYAGRCYTPPAGFATWLEQSGCAGYGILHWTTRPLDIYLKSLSMQVWKNSRDQRLQETCEQMAERTFGRAARTAGGRYLERWVTEAPLFGRETTDRFIDRPLPDTAEIAAASRARVQILDEMPASSLSVLGAKWVSYFREWERFVTDFFASHAAWERSVASLKAGEISQARQQLAHCQPMQVLQQYARLITRLDTTVGEKGLLVSMNLRWLPYIVSQRQALGLETIRWKFEPTENEGLAQQPGRYTFFIDRNYYLWRGWGEKETGQPCFAKTDTPEDIRDAYLEVQKEFSLSLRCMMGEPLLKGKYSARLWFLPVTPQAPEGSAEIEVHGSAQSPPVTDRLKFGQMPIDASAGLGVANYPVEIDQGFLRLDIKPVSGQVRLCGVTIEPVGS
jgi:hypothetical protein